MEQAEILDQDSVQLPLSDTRGVMMQLQSMQLVKIDFLCDLCGLQKSYDLVNVAVTLC